jgi:hypothetical protein
VIVVGQLGAGATSIDPDTGVTLNGATDTVAMSAQYAWLNLVKTGTNAWAVYGGDVVTAAVLNGYFADPSTNGSFSASAWRTDLGLVISTNVQAYDADLTTWAGVTPGTGVATAAAINIGSAGAFATSNSTTTFTEKTFDAAASGNVFKAKDYIYLSHPHLADGTGATLGSTATAITLGHATFSNSADQAANYVEYYFMVPEDIDTSVALRARLKVLLGNTDTGTHRYVVSSVSVADSAVPTASTLANAINIDFAGDGSGASGDVETSAWTTLTSWAGALTAGQTWRIRLARDGDATEDGSTVNSTELGLVIEFGKTQ